MPGSISIAPVARLVDPDRVEAIAILGPTIQFLTPLDDGHAPCVMRGTIPAGVSIPLHSHADPETFMMLAGSVEALTLSGDDVEWVRIEPGQLFHVPGHAKHAFRNDGRAGAVMLITSTTRIAQFFREVGRPATPGTPVPPSPQEIERFLETADRYGYWNASPQENARVGISVPTM